MSDHATDRPQTFLPALLRLVPRGAFAEAQPTARHNHNCAFASSDMIPRYRCVSTISGGRRARQVRLDLRGNGTVFSVAETELAVIVVAPAPERVVDANATGVGAAEADPCPVGVRADLGGGVPVYGVAGPELAVAVVAPSTTGCGWCGPRRSAMHRWRCVPSRCLRRPAWACAARWRRRGLVGPHSCVPSTTKCGCCGCRRCDHRRCGFVPSRCRCRPGWGCAGLWCRRARADRRGCVPNTTGCGRCGCRRCENCRGRRLPSCCRCRPGWCAARWCRLARAGRSGRRVKQDEGYRGTCRLS